MIVLQVIALIFAIMLATLAFAVMFVILVPNDQDKSPQISAKWDRRLRRFCVFSSGFSASILMNGLISRSAGVDGTALWVATVAVALVFGGVVQVAWPHAIPRALVGPEESAP